MDLQFYGANCIAVTYKGTRIIIDDNLAALGAKSITKADDIALFTAPNIAPATAPGATGPGRIKFASPGEYEVADISVIGIPARSHLEQSKARNNTMFKLVVGDQTILVSGHVYPELSEPQLEQIGMIDVLLVPVGGNGFTLDPVGALKLIKSIEPKLVIPTHYADRALNYEVPQQDLANVLRELGMEPKETVTKLKVKASELSDVTQLTVLEKS